MENSRFFERPNQLKMLSRRFIAEFSDSVDELSYKKGQSWLSSGQRSSELLLIQSGAMASSRNYHQVPCVSTLWSDQDIVFSPEAFFQQLPSVQDIWFLTDTTVFSLNSRSASALSAKYDDMDFVISYYLSEAIIRATMHSFMLTYHSPAEKLDYAQATFHKAFNLLTREQQASFLNINRRTLSELI